MSEKSNLSSVENTENSQHGEANESQSGDPSSHKEEGSYSKKSHSRSKNGQNIPSDSECFGDAACASSTSGHNVSIKLSSCKGGVASLYEASRRETSDDISEMCTEESVEKMTSSIEGLVSFSESSGKDTFAQAQQQSWPLRSEMNDLDDSDDQMNDLVGSYREISMDEGTQDDNDTDNEISNLSPDSAAEDDSQRPSSLLLQRSWNIVADASCSACPMNIASEDSRSDEVNLDEILGGLQGLVARNGDMVTFVAEDLQEKIKMASPVTKKDSENPSQCSSKMGTPTLYRRTLSPQPPPVDPAVLEDMELSCQKVATMLDTMTENLTGTLHSISSLAVDCIDTYKEGVCKTCDSVDANIKSMYQLMAKCEEMSHSMKPVFRLQQQLKEIKRLLDIMENLAGGNG